MPLLLIEGNHIVNDSIKSEIRGLAQIRDDQRIQNEIKGCTPLIFNIYSFKASQQLIISPQLKNDSIIHITTESSKKSIELNFLACIDCPIGFQKTMDNAKGCDCVCIALLELYIIRCNYTRETITKKGTTAWITYLSIKNTSDYLIHPYCPMDYCFPPDTAVEINLNVPNGAAAQCAHNLWSLQPRTKVVHAVYSAMHTGLEYYLPFSLAVNSYFMPTPRVYTNLPINTNSFGCSLHIQIAISGLGHSKSITCFSSPLMHACVSFNLQYSR